MAANGGSRDKEGGEGDNSDGKKVFKRQLALQNSLVLAVASETEKKGENQRNNKN